METFFGVYQIIGAIKGRRCAFFGGVEAVFFAFGDLSRSF